MTRLPWRPSPYAAHGSVASEMEVLQTDVMRFMAILGICLMAIFALVQSIPLGPADPRPRLEDRDQLAAEIRILEQQLETLRAEATELERAIGEAQEQSALARLQAETARGEMARLTVQGERARTSRARALAELADLRKRLESQQERLGRLNDQVRERQQALSTLRRKIESAARAAAETERRLARIRTEQVVEPKQPEPPIHPAPASASPAREEGFSLRFASDSTLRALIEREAVAFYAFVGAMVWRLSIRDERLEFQPADKPNAYHEMDPGTVPESFRTGLQRSVAVFGREGVIWGVTLPKATRADIKRAMEGRRGGSLVIQTDGRVRLEPAA